MTDDYDRGHRAAYAAMAVHIAEQLGQGDANPCPPRDPAILASELARRWLTPRLNMLARVEAETLPPGGRSRAEGIAAAWRVAIEDLCATFSIPEPQPDGPGAEVGVQLLQRDEERRGRERMALRPCDPIYTIGGKLPVACGIHPSGGAGCVMGTATAAGVDRGTGTSQTGAVVLEDGLPVATFTGSDAEAKARAHAELRAAVREAAGPSKVGGVMAEQLGAPKGCVCMWLTDDTGTKLARRGAPVMPCPVHPEAQAPQGPPPAEPAECGAVDEVFGPGLGPVCTKPKGHAGGHEAVDPVTGRDVSAWSDLPGEEPPSDPLEPYRTKASPEQRAACLHPPDDRQPLSGDGWLCDICGADCARPEALAEELTDERLGEVEKRARLVVGHAAR